MLKSNYVFLNLLFSYFTLLKAYQIWCEIKFGGNFNPLENLHPKLNLIFIRSNSKSIRHQAELVQPNRANAQKSPCTISSQTAVQKPKIKPKFTNFSPV